MLELFRWEGSAETGSAELSPPSLDRRFGPNSSKSGVSEATFCAGAKLTQRPPLGQISISREDQYSISVDMMCRNSRVRVPHTTRRGGSNAGLLLSNFLMVPRESRMIFDRFYTNINLITTSNASIILCLYSYHARDE